MRTGNEAALELPENIAVVAPTSARGNPPDEMLRPLSISRDVWEQGVKTDIFPWYELFLSILKTIRIQKQQHRIIDTIFGDTFLGSDVANGRFSAVGSGGHGSRQYYTEPHFPICFHNWRTGLKFSVRYAASGLGRRDLWGWDLIQNDNLCSNTRELCHRSRNSAAVMTKSWRFGYICSNTSHASHAGQRWRVWYVSLSW